MKQRRHFVNATFLTLVSIFLILAPMSVSASTNQESSEKGNEVSSSEKGKIIIKYTAPDMDYSKATPEQKKILKEIGWKKENGVFVQYRDVADEIETAIAKGYLPTYEESKQIEESIMTMDGEHEGHNHEMMTDTIKVNGKETEIKDGTFEVEGNPKTINVQYGEDTEQTVTKNKDGKYQIILEKDLGEIMEEMDSHDHEGGMENMNLFGDEPIIGTMGYGDTYSPGDWVHCNRFNGPYSNDKHLRKTNPQAYINFYLSDCDYGALRYCLSHNNCNQKERAAYCSYKQGHSTLYHRH